MPRTALASLLLLAVLAGALAVAAPAANPPPLTGTLGFDDGYADQTRAAFLAVQYLLCYPGRSASVSSCSGGRTGRTSALTASQPSGSGHPPCCARWSTRRPPNEPVT